VSFEQTDDTDDADVRSSTCSLSLEQCDDDADE
jgi:hypothetical protein